VRSSQDDSSKSDNDIRYYLLLAILLVVVIWAASPYVVKRVINETTWAKTADFGNTFGVVNSLFAGLAFGSLVAAILLQKRDLSLQRQELRLQREELELTRTVLDEQRQQLESQAISLRKQTFENTFLQLLGLLRDLRDTARYKPGDTIITGEQALVHVMRNLKNIMLHRSDDDLDTKYLRFHENFKNFTDCFVGTVAEILQFVDKSDLDEKKIYLRLLRTLVSRGELDIVFYQQLSSMKIPAMTSLIEKYGLFIYISDWIPEEHRTLYEACAFEDRLGY
jgi:hypothetical protein